MALLAASAGEVRAAVAIEDVRVGFDGYYKVGSWTPLQATVTTDAATAVQLVVEVPDPDGNPTRIPTVPIELSSGTNELQTLFIAGRLASDVTVLLMSEGRTLDSRTLRPSADPESPLKSALRQSAVLLAVMGDPAGFDRAREQTSGGLLAINLSAEELPTKRSAYDSLDAVVVAGDYALEADRSAALQSWVRGGGHLVLAVGRDVEQYRASPIAEWVPVPVTGPAQLRDLSALESLSGRSVRILFGGRVPGVQLDKTEGQILAESRETPLLVRVPYGLGTVTFFALDINRPPLASWQPLEELLQRLIVREGGGRTAAQQGSQRTRLTHSGISDFATQLNAVQEHFPDVRRFSVWGVMGLMLVYLLVIGPVDYLLVHRVLRKPHYTWITFPAMAIAGVLLAAWGARVINGSELKLNQLDIIDVDAASGEMRSLTWANIYSPETRRYGVAIEPSSAGWVEAGSSASSGARGESGRIRWSGVPEDTFGGMYRPGGLEFGRPIYHFGHDAARLEGVPVPLWSTKGLHGHWSLEAEGLVESDLEATGMGRLTGTFTHHLPAPLEDWMLAFGNRVYLPLRGSGRTEATSLRPHQVMSPGTVYQRELKGFLTRTKAITVQRTDRAAPDILVEQERYDPLSLDATHLLRMLTFHEVTGGRAYTGLENEYLEFLDLSDRLGLGRAVLFGRMQAPAARVELDGKVIEPSQHETFVRILLPVRQTGNIRAKLPKLVE